MSVIAYAVLVVFVEKVHKANERCELLSASFSEYFTVEHSNGFRFNLVLAV